MPDEFPLVYVILISIIAVVIAFVLWNPFSSDTKRTGFVNILGPGGLFGIVIFKKYFNRRKGTTELALSLSGKTLFIIIFVIVVIALMLYFVAASGSTSSGITDSLTDYISNIG